MPLLQYLLRGRTCRRPERVIRPSKVAIGDAKNITGAGDARNRRSRAVKREVPFALFTQSIVIIWYHLAGHSPTIAGARRRASARTGSHRVDLARVTGRSGPAVAGRRKCLLNRRMSRSRNGARRIRPYGTRWTSSAIIARRPTDSWPGHGHGCPALPGNPAAAVVPCSAGRRVLTVRGGRSRRTHCLRGRAGQ
jgi:hypothetical protein